MKPCGQKAHFEQQMLFHALATAALLNMSMLQVCAGNQPAKLFFTVV
jgi:hypothetical protein